MKIISVIDQTEVIKTILRHRNLWVTQKRPPPKTKAPSSEYYVDEQIPAYDCAAPDYPFEAYIKKMIKVEREWCAHKQPFRLR